MWIRIYISRKNSSQPELGFPQTEIEDKMGMNTLLTRTRIHLCADAYAKWSVSDLFYFFYINLYSVKIQLCFSRKSSIGMEAGFNSEIALHTLRTHTYF